MKPALIHINIPGEKPWNIGKVRYIYDVGNDELLVVASDKVSAYDVVMQNGIPGKGIVLTQLSKFWFELLGESGIEHHFITDDVAKFPEPFCNHPEQLAGRSMLVKKVKPLAVECVIRSYLTGSGWKEYQKDGIVCGHKLPAGIQQCGKLPELLFTPATKAELGEHDENIDFERCAQILGIKTAEYVRHTSKIIFERGSIHAEENGIILADTKFEFGTDKGGKIILIDEVLTPDSSRFWPADKYKEGRDQESFDKQFVRNYLESIGFNKDGKGIVLPDDIVEETSTKNVEAFEKLTDKKFSW